MFSVSDALKLFPVRFRTGTRMYIHLLYVPICTAWYTDINVTQATFLLHTVFLQSQPGVEFGRPWFGEYTFALLRLACWALSSSHPHTSSLVATHCLIPGNVVVDGETSVQEHDDAYHRRQSQQLSVDAKPGKVEAYFLPKVFSENKSNKGKSNPDTTGM